MLTTLPDTPGLIHTIERRTGDSRFGISRFNIYSGSRLEGEYDEINEIV